MWTLRASIKRNFGTFRAFGQAVGRSHTYVCNVLNGKQKLRLEEAKEWAAILGGMEVDALPKVIIK